MGQLNRLPSRFPEGTRFIIEGRAGCILSRCIEFPDGRHVDLPVDHGRAKPSVRVRRRSRKVATSSR